VRNDC